jgi:hypothetical protein
MTMCLTKGFGPCCCLKPKVRWCPTCQEWICRSLSEYHLCFARIRFGAEIIHALHARIKAKEVSHA